MGIITDTLGVIDTTVGTVAQQGFEAGAGSLGTTISVGAGLLVALMGANIVAQIKPMTLGSFVAFGVKLTLVAIFAQTWGNFSVVYDILTDVPQSIGNSGVEPYRVLGIQVWPLCHSSIEILSRITEYGDAIGDNAGWVFGAFLGVLFCIIAAVFAAVGAGIIAYATIMLTAMVVVAPSPPPEGSLGHPLTAHRGPTGVLGWMTLGVEEPRTRRPCEPERSRPRAGSGG